MVNYVRAELLKLRRRPAVAVLSTLALASVVLLIYALTYASVKLAAADPQQAAQQLAETRARMYPGLFHWEILRNLSSVFNALALILGALAFGSEYGWGTWKTLLTQRPSRLEIVAAKLGAVAFTVAAWSVGILAVAAVCSYAAALADAAPRSWPPPSEIAAAAGSTFLVLFMWASLGAALAVVLRQAAVTIGIGLVYAAAELILSGTLGRGHTSGVLRSLPGINATALTDSFAPSHAVAAKSALIGPGQALLVLAAYTAAFMLTAALLVRNRDVT